MTSNLGNWRTRGDLPNTGVVYVSGIQNVKNFTETPSVKCVSNHLVRAYTTVHAPDP